MDYTTQMDAARKGILTKEMGKVAAKEQFEPTELMRLVAEGKVAIPANRNGMDALNQTESVPC